MYEANILDFYDDHGALLRRKVSELSEIPEFVKSAGQINQATSPNQFALVMIESGRALKKYATADKGNTWLSNLYFGQTHHSLPEQAQKIAAANIKDACEHYSIEPSAAVTELSAEDIRTNILDVTGLTPPMRKVASEKEDVLYAIERADGTKYYPLNNTESISAANEYFERSHGMFQPRERREYAVKLASAMEDTGMLKTAAQRYAGTGYSPILEAHILVRHKHLIELDASEDLHDTLEKLASSRSDITPEHFATILERFDREAGLDQYWDSYISDPYATTFSMVKEAKGDDRSEETFQVGPDTVTADELRSLAANRMVLVDHFGEAFALSFEKKPTEIFQSMPLPQKRILARLASDAQMWNS